jgi:hypothetical protein
MVFKYVFGHYDDRGRNKLQLLRQKIPDQDFGDRRFLLSFQYFNTFPEPVMCVVITGLPM